MELLRANGKTILFVSHNMGMVKYFCDSAILLNNGEIVAEGPVLDIVPMYEEIMESEEGFGAKRSFEVPTLV